MNFTIENQGNNTYLVYEVDEAHAIDTLSLGMLTNNKIHGLAQTIFMQVDNQKFIKYNISAKICVSQFFLGAVNKKRLIGVFSGIVNALLSSEDYMIDPASILLDTDYIFADVSTCESDLICLPVANEQVQPDVGSFFRDVMFKTQFDQTENCDHVAKIINYLNSTPMFSLVDFKKILDDIGREPTVARPMQEQPSVSTRPVQAQVKVEIPAAPAPTVQYRQPVAPVPQNQGRPQPARVPQAPAPAPAPQPPAPQVSSENKISWFYLMQHYNRENAALYKAQKEAKKAAKAGGVPQAQQVPTKPMKEPRANSPVGFAVPGQQTSVPTPPPQPRPVGSAVQASPVGDAPAYRPTVEQPAYATPQMPQGQAMSFGETTVLGTGGIGETTVLGANSAVQPKPYLIRAKNNEKIELNKPVFRIGKEKSYVDYFIGDNSAISRSHANIITRDGAYFVIDTNSTNHTYLNGQMLQSNAETPITHGAKIRLANEDFDFKLY